MSTAPAPVLESFDDRGLSIVTSTMTNAEPRRGTLYRPDTLAAGLPVYYHPMQNGTFLALFSFRWINATVGLNGPQSYLSFDQSDRPCSSLVDPVSGGFGPVTDLPVRSSSLRGLAGACGRVDTFWTVGRDANGNGVIGMYRINRQQVVLLQAEEILPPFGDVTFSAGCAIDDTRLVVFGTDSAGHVFAARKNWGRIGVLDAPDGVWTYHSPKGWDTDISAMIPVGPITVGPVSMANRWGRVWLSTVNKTGEARTGRVWTGRTLSSLKSVAATSVALGDTTTYLGGGLHLQPQINARLGAYPDPRIFPSAPPPAPALLYLTSVLGVSPGEQSILNDWGQQTLV